MTRDETLDLARAHVAEIGKASPFARGPLLDQTRAVLEVARFLMAEEGTATQEVTEHESDDDEGLTPLGAYHEVKCSVDGLDGAATRAGRHPRLGPVVTLDLTVDGEVGRVLLTPTAARQFAAGMLNDADTAEGREGPLLFPDAGEGPVGALPRVCPWLRLRVAAPPAATTVVPPPGALLTPR